MKTVITLAIVSLLFFTPGRGLAADEVTKTHCALATDYDSMDALKTDILAQAKQLAVNELFGELITASTTVENFVVTSAEITSFSAGYVRVDEISYYNGAGLGEICVTIGVYITEEDRAKFEPVLISQRYCSSDPNLSVGTLRRFTRDEALVQALIEYNRNLEEIDRARLLRLVQKVTYPESDFLPGTETYCVIAQGNVLPIEILAILGDNHAQSNTPTGIVTPSPPTATATPSPTQTPTRVSTSTPIPTPRPTQRTTRIATATPTRPLPVDTPAPNAWSPPSLLSPGANQTIYKNTVSSILFRWSGGTACTANVTCRLSIDRMHGNEVSGWAVISKQVQGQQATLGINELPPGDYQWTVVLWRGQERLNPVPLPFRVEDSQPSGGSGSPLPTPVSPLSTPSP